MVTGYLLDTNVVSETQKLRPNANLSVWLDSIPNDSLYLSVLTIGEVQKGVIALSSRDPKKSLDLANWLLSLETRYADRVLGIDIGTALEWGTFAADRSRPVIDTLITATAHHHGLVLVTRNTTDFKDLPIRVIDPFA